MGVNLEAKVLSEKDIGTWNDLVDTSPWGDILQYWQWGEAKRGEGWTPYRIAVFEGDKIISGAQCLVKKASFLGSYMYVPHGPVFTDKAQLKRSLGVLREKLIEVATDLGCFVIEIEPKTGLHVDDNSITENLKPFIDEEIFEVFKGAGFKLTGRNMQPKYKLLYDLKLSDDELLALMKKNTRYNVRLAKKKGVVINEYLPDDPRLEDKLREFYALLKLMQKRAKGYPVRPYESFVNLFKNFRGTENIALFEALYDDDVITMNISERTDKWSSSFYAGSNRLHSNVKAAYLLRWESVKKAKSFGSNIYDFWGIIPGSDQHKGYSDTKLSFGGTRIDHVGILALPLDRFEFMIWDKILPVRTKLFSIFRSLKP
ncbi:MAG: lipid II:glycine glycyltransferase FemX [Candidatus Dojkabacteria bacterium]